MDDGWMDTDHVTSAQVTWSVYSVSINVKLKDNNCILFTITEFKYIINILHNTHFDLTSSKVLMPT